MGLFGLISLQNGRYYISLKSTIPNPPYFSFSTIFLYNFYIFLCAQSWRTSLRCLFYAIGCSNLSLSIMFLSVVYFIFLGGVRSSRRSFDSYFSRNILAFLYFNLVSYLRQAYFFGFSYSLTVFSSFRGSFVIIGLYLGQKQQSFSWRQQLNKTLNQLQLILEDGLKTRHSSMILSKMPYFFITFALFSFLKLCELPWKGCIWYSISCRMTPMDQMSLLMVQHAILEREKQISGAIVQGVPHLLLSTYNQLPRHFASPKSAILILLSLTRMFQNLRSRWMILRDCSTSMPYTNYSKYLSAISILKSHAISSYLRFFQQNYKIMKLFEKCVKMSITLTTCYDCSSFRHLRQFSYRNLTYLAAIFYPVVLTLPYHTCAQVPEPSRTLQMTNPFFQKYIFSSIQGKRGDMGGGRGGGV